MFSRTNVLRIAKCIPGEGFFESQRRGNIARQHFSQYLRGGQHTCGSDGQYARACPLIELVTVVPCVSCSGINTEISQATYVRVRYNLEYQGAQRSVVIRTSIHEHLIGIISIGGADIAATSKGEGR